MVKMTRIVLPGMKERKKGAIINIGSFAGSTTDPFYSIYSGSKVCKRVECLLFRVYPLDRKQIQGMQEVFREGVETESVRACVRACVCACFREILSKNVEKY